MLLIIAYNQQIADHSFLLASMTNSMTGSQPWRCASCAQVSSGNKEESAAKTKAKVEADPEVAKKIAKAWLLVSC